MIPKWIPAVLSVFILLAACRRVILIIPPPPPAPPVDSTKTIDTLSYVKGTWQCQIDGVNYSGTIDTSFTHYDSSFEASNPDTVLFCTGSSSDKKANIHFQVDFNRYPVRNVPYFTTATNKAQIDFDTCSDNILQAAYGESEVQFTIDSVSSTSVQAHFSGTLSAVNGNGVTSTGHTITNGKFSAGWRGGDHDPNSFIYTSTLKMDGYDPNVNGYFNRATMTSNTLVLDGTPINWDGQSRFKLLVRTGSTIKPGVYHSENGDVGLQLYVPSINRNYVDDSSGSLTVTISQVSGNAVYGSFSGSNKDGSSLSGGSFAARITNYVPEADSANEWGFGAFQEASPNLVYHIYGGNVVSGALSNNAGRYYLTVNGASDNGASTFKLVLSSTIPIQQGTYTISPYFPGVNSVDSFYFSSPEPEWNGAATHYSAIAYYSNPTQVIIDTIDAHHATGRLQGDINISNNGNVFASFLQLGKFSTHF